MMKQISLSLTTLFLCSSCAFHSAGDDNQHKTEFAINKMRTDIEELKQDFNSNQMELNILEGKILSQDTSLTQMKEKTLDSWQNRLEKYQQVIASMEKKLEGIEKKHEKISREIYELTRHANDTTTALSQYKARIADLENLLAYQNDRLKEVASLRTTLENWAQKENFDGQLKRYKVQKGDTLKKIAKNLGTTPERLKELNQLTDDTIYAEQEILLPANTKGEE